MDASELHNIALQASDAKIEVAFVEELNQIITAAQAGRFSIILNNNNFTDTFINYLRRKNFRIAYYRDDQHLWCECYENTNIPWFSCSKLCIKW